MVPRSTGKIFVIKLLATSRIATTPLPRGQTLHSTFKLTFDLSNKEDPVYDISKYSGISELIQRHHFIVWDECIMADKNAFESVDRTLQDIRNCNTNTMMVNVTVLLLKDFCQILPVVQKETKVDELNKIFCIVVPYENTSPFYK